MLQNLSSQTLCYSLVVWFLDSVVMNIRLNLWLTTCFCFHLQKHRVMVEVTGNQSMVSIMFNLFLSQGKSLYELVYPIHDEGYSSYGDRQFLP
jgi:hypothetical protein